MLKKVAVRVLQSYSNLRQGKTSANKTPVHEQLLLRINNNNNNNNNNNMFIPGLGALNSEHGNY